MEYKHLRWAWYVIVPAASTMLRLEIKGMLYIYIYIYEESHIHSKVNL